MKTRSLFLRTKALFFALFAPLLLSAATYNNMSFTVELCDASGNLIPTTSTSGHTVCKGDVIYVKNTSHYNCFGGPIGGPGLQGRIDIYYFAGSSTYYLASLFDVNAAPGGTWNYGELLTITMNATTGGTPFRYLYCEYWPDAGEVTFATGCTADPSLDFLCYGRVMALPSFTVSASPSAICAGSSSTLTATGSGFTYNWSTGATGSSTVVSPASTTTYNVTATNGYGCSATKPVTVTVNQPPSVHEQDYVLCPGDPMPVLNAGSGAASYNWTYNGSLASNTQYVNTAAFGYGTYVATVTGTNGCVGTGTFNVLLDPSATPDAHFTYSLSTTTTQVKMNATAVASNTNNTWNFYHSNASGAQLGWIHGFSISGGIGNTYASPWVAINNWYRLDHAVSNPPCLVVDNSHAFFYASDSRRLGQSFETGQPALSVIDFQAYPNPTSGSISIKVNSSLDGAAMQFAVYDLTGRQVTADLQCLPGEELQIDLGAQPKGIYLLKAQSQDEIMTTKVVVQ